MNARSSGRTRSGASSARKWPQSANSCTSQSESSERQRSTGCRRAKSSPIGPPQRLRQEQRHVLQFQLVEKCRKRLRMHLGVMVLLAAVAARRQPEPHVIRGDATELRPQSRDQVPELERPRRIAVHEDDRLPRSLVDVVHDVAARRTDEATLEGEHLVGHPSRPHTGRRTTHEPILRRRRLWPSGSRHHVVSSGCSGSRDRNQRVTRCWFEIALTFDECCPEAFPVRRHAAQSVAVK